MVTWSFIGGNPSILEQNTIKETFLNGLAEFREEFESRKPFVTINLKQPPESPLFANFTFGDSKEVDGLIDFIRRFQLVYPSKGI
jgi:hypothetical protein